jgi:hypothetical protein
MSGGITKDATVKLGVEVDSELSTAADRIFGSIERSAQNVYGHVKSAASAAGQALGNVAMDVARVSTALTTVDLGASVSRFVTYREEVARTAAATGRSFDQLAGNYKAVGDRLAISDETVSRFSRGLQQATYDAGDSSRAIAALGNEALATNRSLDQMAPIGEALHNELAQSFEDIPDALARIDAAAENLATSGGPAALQAQVAALGGTISQVSIKGREDFAAIVGSIGELGRGLPAKQQERVQQRILGRIMSDTEGLRRNLGAKFEDFYDEQGRVKDLPALIQSIQQMATKRWGLRAREVLSQGQNFGPEAAAAIMAYDPAAARAAATAAPSTTAADLAQSFRQSGVGEDIATRNRIDEDKRDQAGKLLADWQTKIGKLFLGHPIAGAVATQTGLRLGADLVKWAFTPTAVGGIAASGGAGGGAAAAANVASKVSPIGRVATGGLGWLGGGSAAIGLGAIAAALATTMAGIKMTGLDRFNATIGAQEQQIRAQFDTTRIGRVRAIVRAADRAGGAGLTPERYRSELGPRLYGEIARDPLLQLAASGAANREVPAALTQQAPELAAALKEALRDAIQVQVQLVDDSSSPHRVVAVQKGARQ